MANYTNPRNPDHPNHNKFLWADMANGAADGRNDPIVPERLYRVVCVITAADNLRIIAPHAVDSDGNLQYADVDLDGDTAQEINLNTVLADKYEFPANVIRGESYARVVTVFNVVTSPVFEFGDADDNALIASTALDSAAYVASGGAEEDPVVETAFVPTLNISTSSGNLDTITAGVLELGIFYKQLPY